MRDSAQAVSNPLFLNDILIWIAVYCFTLVCLRLSYAEAKEKKRKRRKENKKTRNLKRRKLSIILGSVVGTQLLLKLFDRYYLPNFSLRAGDENFWLQSLAAYQTNGTIPVTTLAQGAGIFYASSIVGHIFNMSFDLALVALAIVLGCLYVLPAYGMYAGFAQGKSTFALVGVLLVSMSDVMIYSTTVARPTLFGLFLLPLAIRDVQLLYEKGSLSVFLRLFVVTFLVLLFHTPISYVVILLVLSLLLVLRKATKWVAAYVIMAFGSYGVFLKFALPDLYRIWRVELFGAYPLSLLPSVFGGDFFLLFFVAAFALVTLSWLVAYARERAKMYVTARKPKVGFLLLWVGLGLVLGTALVVLKYSSYIVLTYGSPSTFLLLHGWKIVFAVLTIYGITVSLRKKIKGLGVIMPLSWLISVGLTVAFLATYSPIGRFGGLWNLDERFAEFLYYPAFYFIAIGITSLRRTLPRRVFDWVALPCLTLFVIPSIIVGTKDPTFFK